VTAPNDRDRFPTLLALCTKLSNVANEFIVVTRKRAFRAVSFMTPLGKEGHCAELEMLIQAAWVFKSSWQTALRSAKTKTVLIVALVTMNCTVV
jgi:hypothetical protein